MRGWAGNAFVTQRALAGRPEAPASSRLEVERWLRDARGNDRVFAADDLDFLRGQGIPLALTWKDPWILLYADPAEARDAERRLTRIRDLGAQQLTAATATQVLRAAGACIGVFFRDDVSEALIRSPQVELVNERYVIVRADDVVGGPQLCE